MSLLTKNLYHKTTNANAAPEELIANASSIKRFIELWRGDKIFRERLNANPQQIIEEYPLEIEPKAIRMLWDKEYSQQNQTFSPIIKKFRRFVEIFDPLQVRQELLHQAKDFRFRAWRKRQKARDVYKRQVFI